MLTFLIVLGLERVVEVGTKQPCFTFRGKLVRAFWKVTFWPCMYDTPASIEAFSLNA